MVIPGTVIRHPVEDHFQAQRMGLINESPKAALVTKLRIYGKIVFHRVRAAKLTFAMFLTNRMDRHQPQDLRAQPGDMSQFFSNTIKRTGLTELAGINLINNRVFAPVGLREGVEISRAISHVVRIRSPVNT